ncbi:MAG: flagellar hook capping FlgD N-terminal domain-containing protein [Acetobacteraceae bacterium]|jgi:flagellar basal-body rod modification protein FlgD
MSIASVAAQQNSLITAANAAAAGAPNATASAASGTSAATQTGATALSSLSGNFTDFLNMLMTQLQNQDPTSPMDTNAFTTELVQFSSVEQQINTNTSLTSLIQLTQAGEVMQGSNMTGKQVTVTSDHLALQNGKGTIQFATSTAQPVAIAIYNDSGTKLQDATLTSVKGTNTWTWDGSNASGATMPDGAYKVAVAAADSSGTVSALPFSVVGTATGVQSLSTGMQLRIGALSVDFSKVQSVGN